MNDKYILKGHEPVPCDDTIQWGLWMESADRHVAQATIGDVQVSTVFLGLDHSFERDAEPLVFETMIFGGEHDGYMDRYSTWLEAEEGHQRALAMVKP